MNVPLIPIRCPQCHKKLGEGLEGTYIARCRGCGWFVTVVRDMDGGTQSKAISPVKVDGIPRAVVYR